MIVKQSAQWLRLQNFDRRLKELPEVLSHFCTFLCELGHDSVQSALSTVQRFQSAIKTRGGWELLTVSDIPALMAIIESIDEVDCACCHCQCNAFHFRLICISRASSCPTILTPV